MYLAYVNTGNMVLGTKVCHQIFFVDPLVVPTNMEMHKNGVTIAWKVFAMTANRFTNHGRSLEITN